MLKRMEVLKPVVLEGLTGNLTPKSFYHHVRARRVAGPYILNMLEAAKERGHLELGLRAALRARSLKNSWKARMAFDMMHEACLTHLGAEETQSIIDQGPAVAK